MIPLYTIWAFDVVSKQWEDITKDVKDAEAFNRTWGGTSLSIPKFNESIHLDGLVTNRTSGTFPNGTFTAQGQFLYFNYSSNILSDWRFYKPPITNGYWHGSLKYIPVRPKGSKGWLISLMSQKGELGKSFPDKPVENDEFGSDWDSAYDPNSQYHTSAVVQVNTESGTPAKWADDSVQTAFEPRKANKSLEGGQIAGIVVGVIAFILAVLFFLIRLCKRKPTPQEDAAQELIDTRGTSPVEMGGGEGAGSGAGNN
ncbi:MAG: hypothetical protein M1813_008375 [Trichoglossum hirsutum]|nr:MAG: hypothetical protein M1813_008375 [Trichoglossum hirsutum]